MREITDGFQSGPCFRFHYGSNSLDITIPSEVVKTMKINPGNVFRLIVKEEKKESGFTVRAGFLYESMRLGSGLHIPRGRKIFFQICLTRCFFLLRVNRGSSPHSRRGLPHTVFHDFVNFLSLFTLPQSLLMERTDHHQMHL